MDFIYPSLPPPPSSSLAGVIVNKEMLVRLVGEHLISPLTADAEQEPSTARSVGDSSEPAGGSAAGSAPSWLPAGVVAAGTTPGTALVVAGVCGVALAAAFMAARWWRAAR